MVVRASLTRARTGGPTFEDPRGVEGRAVVRHGWRCRSSDCPHHGPRRRGQGGVGRASRRTQDSALRPGVRRQTSRHGPTHAGAQLGIHLRTTTTPAVHKSSTPTEKTVMAKRFRGETYIGLIAVSLACLAAGCSTGREASSSGPLSLGTTPSGVSYSADAGSVLTFGANIAVNTGDDPITLRSVDLVAGNAGGVDVESVKVIPLPGLGVTPIAITKGFPTPFLPNSQLRDVNGHIVSGNAGEDAVELVFVLRVTKPGRWNFTGVHVDYEVNGQQKTLEYPNFLVLCAPFVTKCSFDNTAVG